MCNPRRVNITATREVVEAWQVEVERRVSRTDTVVSEVEVAYPFGGTLGARTREAFERALASAPGWQEADGVFVLDLPDGRVTYRPSTGELVVTARLEEEARAEGRASAVLSGTVSDTAQGEGEGRYYDDNYGGITYASAEADARRQAEHAAESQAMRLLEDVRRQARDAADTAASAADEGLRAAAGAEAETRLAAERERLQAELESQNRERLQQLASDGLSAVNEVLAASYRQAILAYAREHGATGIQVEESDHVIDIEFEMEA
ncbi:hypothetical protein [Streptomyces sp. NPDC003688]